MLSHGHSFVRLFTWQLACWGFWAVIAPWTVRLSGRYSLGRLAALGLVLTMVHGAVAAQMTVWFQPYQPVAFYTVRQGLATLWWALVTDRSARVSSPRRRWTRLRRPRTRPAARASRDAARSRADARDPRRAAARNPAALPVQHAERHRRADSHQQQCVGVDDAARAERPDAGDARSAGRAARAARRRAERRQGATSISSARASAIAWRSRTTSTTPAGGSRCRRCSSSRSSRTRCGTASRPGRGGSPRNRRRPTQRCRAAAVGHRQRRRAAATASIHRATPAPACATPGPASSVCTAAPPRSWCGRTPPRELLPS